MERTAPGEETTERSPWDMVREARALREEYRRDPERDDDEASPQAFFERMMEREDVREIMRRLAEA